MKKGQTSVRGGIQDLLCPFTYVAITQGSNVGTHRGTKAVDIGFKNSASPREPYYAPCDVKCVWTYPSNGQAMWQSVNKVRLANGKINYVTFVTCHDSSFDAKVGQVVKQGKQLGNKGDKGGATGIHCHIELAIGKKTIADWHKNSYGIWTFNDEVYFDDAFFMDNTECKKTMGDENWRYLKGVSVNTNTSAKKKLYLPASATRWRIYKIGVKPIVGNECGFIYPSRFGGLTYDIISLSNDVAVIQTRDYGKVQIYVASSTGATIK